MPLTLEFLADTSSDGLGMFDALRHSLGSTCTLTGCSSKPLVIRLQMLWGYTLRERRLCDVHAPTIGVLLDDQLSKITQLMGNHVYY